MALYELGKAHFRLNSDDTFEYLGKIIKREFFNGFNKDLTSRAESIKLEEFVKISDELS